MGDKHWNVIGCSVRGHSHERSGRPNEDAVAMGKVGSYGGVFAVLSDGHGSRTCFRSAYGSAKAVAVASDALSFPQSRLWFKAPTGMRFLAEEILNKWREAVITHLKKNPFTGEELEGLDASQRATLGRNAFVAYGATLLICCVLEEETLFFQLGDGDFLVLDTAGAVSKVFPSDSRHIGNATTSLCLPNALHEFKYSRMPEANIQMVLGSTDGYGNSFKSETDFNRTIKDYEKLISDNGRKAVEKNLPGWLSETSQFGSGDDISVALIYREIGK